MPYQRRMPARLCNKVAQHFRGFKGHGGGHGDDISVVLLASRGSTRLAA